MKYDKFSNPRSQIQSLDRAFSLIEILATKKEPIDLKTITELSGLPKPTVYRMLTSLEIWGYVRQTPLGYKLGTKFLSLGGIVQDDLEIRKIARPHLKKLNEDTKETIFLGILENDRSLYIDKIDSQHTVRLASKVGTRNYLHSTSLGKCLLSGLNDTEINELINRVGMPALTKNTIIDFDKFLEAINQVRRMDFAIDDMENEEGVRCVAAPIKDYQGNIIAALSISGPAQRITDQAIEQKLVPHLVQTAQNISKALGHLT